MINRVFAFCAVLAIASCGGDTDSAQPDTKAEGRDHSDSAIESVATEVKEPFTPPPTKADDFDWPEPTARALIKTSIGEITVELYGDEAPNTVENFLTYVADGHYDRTIIHRVVEGFVIQGGGYNQYYSERATRDPVPYEGDNGLPNYRGTLAMARTMDPQSAAAQWYINLRDNQKLDHLEDDLGVRYGYTVFGRVVAGMETADKIGMVDTGPAGPFEAEVPISTIVVERVETLD
jgi:cyclophilin family peptidyl-prolyl cis-trans isomerase